jgi:hypothetical protein
MDRMGSTPLPARACLARENGGLRRSAHNLGRELKRKIFFIWIPRNALKSPKSAKRIQGKPFAGGKGAYGTVLRHYHALFIILPSAQGPLYADRVKTPELATRLAGRALAQILQGSRGPQQL